MGYAYELKMNDFDITKANISAMISIIQSFSKDIYDDVRHRQKKYANVKKQVIETPKAYIDISTHQIHAQKMIELKNLEIEMKKKENADNAIDPSIAVPGSPPKKTTTIYNDVLHYFLTRLYGKNNPNKNQQNKPAIDDDTDSKMKEKELIFYKNKAYAQQIKELTDSDTLPKIETIQEWAGLTTFLAECSVSDVQIPTPIWLKKQFQNIILEEINRFLKFDDDFITTIRKMNTTYETHKDKDSLSSTTKWIKYVLELRCDFPRKIFDMKTVFIDEHECNIFIYCKDLALEYLRTFKLCNLCGGLKHFAWQCTNYKQFIAPDFIRYTKKIAKQHQYAGGKRAVIRLQRKYRATVCSNCRENHHGMECPNPPNCCLCGGMHEGRMDSLNCTVILTAHTALNNTDILFEKDCHDYCNMSYISAVTVDTLNMKAVKADIGFNAETHIGMTPPKGYWNEDTNEDRDYLAHFEKEQNKLNFEQQQRNKSEQQRYKFIPKRAENTKYTHSYFRKNRNYNNNSRVYVRKEKNKNKTVSKNDTNPNDANTKADDEGNDPVIN